jgi:fused signal recognition particle receptor
MSWKNDGRSVLLCAADTFRAAAAEQLQVWAERVGAPFHRGAEGADPASVLTDGLRTARSRHMDAVLVDTAGRLHTKSNLMAELEKMGRVAGREIPGAPHETLLVLDATVGSNGLAQGREFAKAAKVTGLILTKLDGTAKGGVAVAVVRELGVPIRYVGVGESADDLLPFDAASFAEALVGAE